MRYTIVRKDLLKRNYFAKHESKRQFCKMIQQNFKVDEKILIHYRLNRGLNYFRDGSSSRIKNRCILTGRGRSIYRDFRLSRMQIRHLASFGYLLAIKKSSW